jgi:Cu(I)/Ag(I) efflux system membrane protein CusA/SilA
MIAALIRWSIVNRFLVLLAAVMLAAWGLWAVWRTPVDAIPDLSDVQVIVRTSFPGQAPRIVEDQVTYPLTTTMMSVPGARAVRGYSFFGDSFVYVLFEDGTDLYWARSRVLEYLNQVQSRLPPGAKASIGTVIEAIRNANRETGGSVLEQGEAEYMVRASGYLRTLEDFRSIPLRTSEGGRPCC